MQTALAKFRLFLDPDNRWNDKTFEKVLTEISAPPPKKSKYVGISCCLLDFAKHYGIAYEGTQPISGITYHVFNAPKGVRWEDIDTLLAVFTHLEINSTVQHEKRPPRKIYDYQVICDETNNPPSAVEAGNLNVDILLDGHHVSTDLSKMGIEWEGKASQKIDPDFAKGFAQGIVDTRALRGMSRCATSEMLAQLEDDQMQFGLEALNNYLGDGIRPGALAGADVAASLDASLEKVRKEAESYVPEQVYRTSEEREEIAHQLTTTLKPGEPETVATAYPTDLEERRAALAAENEQAGIGRGRLRPFEAPYGAQTGRVSCAEENPSTVPSTHEENAQKFFDVSKINPEFGAAIEVKAAVTITKEDLDAPFGPADKALRQAELQLQADELNEFRREVGRPATVTPAYLSALSAAHVRSKQKKVKTKTKNRKKR